MKVRSLEGFLFKIIFILLEKKVLFFGGFSVTFVEFFFGRVLIVGYFRRVSCFFETFRIY